MQRWIKQNLTIAVILTLLTGYGVGAAVAAVLKNDVELLKIDVKILKERIAETPEKLGRIEERIIAMQKQSDRIENKLDAK